MYLFLAELFDGEEAKDVEAVVERDGHHGAVPVVAWVGGWLGKEVGGWVDERLTDDACKRSSLAFSHHEPPTMDVNQDGEEGG